MVTGTLTVHTATPPEVVQAYLADFRHQVEWRDDVLDCELESGTAGENGAVYRQTVEQGPGGTAVRRLRAHVQAESGRVDFETLGNAPVLAAGTNSISGVDGTTTVEGTIHVTFTGGGNLLRPMVSRVMKRRMPRYEQELKARLDALTSGVTQ